MVVRVVGDVAGVPVLLEAADAVLETGRAGNGPGASERFSSRRRDGTLRVLVERDRERLQRVEVGERPRLRAVREVAVGEQDDRRHVCHRDANRLDRHVVAVARRRSGQHRERRVAVAPPDRLEEIGLFGLRRKAGRRPATLHVDDDKGSSAIIAKPIASDFNATPGPDVPVTPIEPPKLAPTAAATAAISSSAWKVVTPKCLRRAKLCSRLDAGVIG